MKKIFLLLFLAIAGLASSQQNYYTFKIDDKTGITDTLGKEIIKPIFKFSYVINAKNQIYLQNYSDAPDIIFNTKTGAKISYEKVYSNQVKIKNVPFSEIRNKGKRFLLSEETDKTFDLTQNYSDFENAGRYILEKYNAYEIPKTKAKAKPKYIAPKTKKGVPPPPQPLSSIEIEPSPVRVDYFGIRTNDDDFKTIKKIKAKSFLQFYKVPVRAKTEDGRIGMVELKDYQLNAPEDEFDIIVFSNDKTHSIYNDKLVLVKEFVLADADESMLKAAAEKTVKLELSKYSENHQPPPPSIGVRRGEAEEKIVYPFLYTKTLGNGNIQFALQQTKENSKTFFEASPKSKIRFTKGRNTVFIETESKRSAYFTFNPKTGEVYLPKAYLIDLGITTF